MTYTTLSEPIRKVGTRALQSSRFLTLALAVLVAMAAQPAHAQSSDTWKSVAIIGGSTAAGAFIGHKVGGSTGTLIGAGAGAAAGYAIDRHRRANAYYNNNPYAYGPYGSDSPYYGNGGYNGGPYGGTSSYPSGYQGGNR